MVAFGLVAKEYASIRGVAMEPSALGVAPTFTVFKDAQLMRRARCEGLRELGVQEEVVQNGVGRFNMGPATYFVALP